LGSNKITIIDYVGHSNKNNEPIGHVLKYISEYSELIQDLFSFNLIIPKIYENKIQSENKIFLDYNCQNASGNLIVKLKNLYFKLYNLKKIFTNAETNNLWFVNVEWLFFVFLFFYPTKKNIFITMYRQNFSSGKNLFSKLKNFFLYKSQKKINGIIVTNPNISFNNNILYIPDYFYKKEYYGKYSNSEKIEQVILLGRMNSDKEIEKTVKLFKDKSMKLKIIGSFEDSNLYQKLKKIKTNNIEIKNDYLSEEEYYKLMGESKYIILPYKREIYANKTSGVLIEAMFLNTIPIAPNFLLKHNKIPGIGYDNLNEINKIEFQNFNHKSIYDKYSKKRENQYSFFKTKNKLSNFFKTDIKKD